MSTTVILPGPCIVRTHYSDDRWDDWEPSAEQIEYQASKLIDTEEFLEFVSCEFTADSDPVCVTAFNGWISPEQMIRECVKPDASPEKCKAFFVQMYEAMKERFDADILDAALKQAKEDAEEAAWDRQQERIDRGDYL